MGIDTELETKAAFSNRAYVHFWHKADMPFCAANVCSRGKSGHFNLSRCAKNCIIARCADVSLTG
jgi:hypothetical protein